MKKDSIELIEVALTEEQKKAADNWRKEYSEMRRRWREQVLKLRNDER